MFWVKIEDFRASKSFLSLFANFLVSDWSKPESNALSSFRSLSYLFRSLPPADPSASELEEWDAPAGVRVAMAWSCGNFWNKCAFSFAPPLLSCEIISQCDWLPHWTCSEQISILLSDVLTCSQCWLGCEANFYFRSCIPIWPCIRAKSLSAPFTSLFLVRIGWREVEVLSSLFLVYVMEEDLSALD